MELSLAGVSVALVMPTNRDLPWQTVGSLLETQSALQSRGIPSEVQLQVGASIVTHARTKAVHAFLKTDKNRLFWVDSDIEWEAESFLRLLALSTVMDVVGAAYPSKQERSVFFIDTKPGSELASNEYGCLPIDGWGLGFTCVNRRVIEALCERAEKVRFHDIDEPVANIFRCDVADGKARGEDIAFFSDVRDCGFGVFLDPSITLGHIGQRAWKGRLMDHLKEHSNGTSD